MRNCSVCPSMIRQSVDRGAPSCEASPLSGVLLLLAFFSFCMMAFSHPWTLLGCWKRVQQPGYLPHAVTATWSHTWALRAAIKSHQILNRLLSLKVDSRARDSRHLDKYCFAPALKPRLNFGAPDVQILNKKSLKR